MSAVRSAASLRAGSAVAWKSARSVRDWVPVASLASIISPRLECGGPVETSAELASQPVFAFAVYGPERNKQRTLPGQTVWVSPGFSRTTCAEVRDSTSDLKAALSVAIGGKVS